ncbi:MAG TPA: hypothetical protein VIF09_29215 [Polyangiaceae bacterium]
MSRPLLLFPLALAMGCGALVGIPDVPPGVDASPASEGGGENDGGGSDEDGADAISGEGGGGGGACDPDAASWSPASVPGLVLWLEADTLTLASGSPVALWHDQSSAGNDAKQPVSSYQPTLEAAAVGGRPALSFDGRQSFLTVADSVSLQWGTGDYTFLIVGQFSDSGVPNQMLYQKVSGGPPYDGPALFVNSDKPAPGSHATSQISQDFYVTSLTAGFANAPHLFASRRAGTSLEVRIDGVVNAEQVTSTDVSNPGQAAMIGQNGYNPRAGNEALAGLIAAVVAAGGPIADHDLQALECYLMSKYGVAAGAASTPAARAP